jgi:hypothetical protein
MSESESKNQSSSGAFPAGVILIVLGVVFLFQQNGGFSLNNWWALFILIPAIGAIGSAWTIYRKSERFGPAVFGTLFGGLFPLLVAMIFLLNLDWAVWWPAFLILGGTGTLLGGFGLMDENPHSEWATRMFRPWGITLGLGMLALGLGFLTNNMGTFDPFAIHERWWAIPILIAATGGVLAAAMSIGKPANGKLATTHFDTTGSLALSGLAAATGLMLLFDWNMRLLMPAVLIGIGLVILAGGLFRRRETPPGEPLR